MTQHVAKVELNFATHPKSSSQSLPPTTKPTKQTRRLAVVQNDGPPETITQKLVPDSSIMEIQSTSAQDSYHPVITSDRPYVEEGFCEGCRHIVADQETRDTCGTLMDRMAVEQNISRAEAIRMQVEHFHREDCRPCLLESCADDERQKFWRYDHAAPTILQAHSHYLSSIAESNRIPSSLLQNSDTVSRHKGLLQYFSKPENTQAQRKYLFEYNPSLVQIPEGEIPSIEEGQSPVYLASYRVSTQQSCFPNNITLAMIGGSWKERPKRYDYLGLALLRSDFSVIQDVVINQNRRRSEDFRLFVFDGQMYYTTFCIMVPLWLKAPVSMKGKFKAEQVFPSPMQVFLGKDATTCSDDPTERGSGKNINYFRDSQGNIRSETLPMNPHTTNKIQWNEHPDPKDRTIDEYIPNASFLNTAELDMVNRYREFEYPFVDDRGGACCVPVQDPRSDTNNSNNKTLLLGISHTKTRRGRLARQGVVESHHYFSRFYAFDASPPFEQVALSGFFCLPANPNSSGAETTSTNSSNHHTTTTTHTPYSRIPEWDLRPLQVAGTSYDCPAIHFVSGMIEKADDPSKLVIAYGVSDCTSWFVEISKSQVVDLLFSSSPRKKSEQKNRTGSSKVKD